MIYIPIIGSIILAAIVILERTVLIKKKINIRLFQTATFLAAVLVMIPLIYFFWRLDAPALEMKNILILAGVIIVSVLANLSVFYAIKGEKISELEPALIMEPLFTVLLAILFSFFTVGLYERNLNVIIPALIAGLALVLSHVKKQHLQFNKYMVAAVIGSFFFALELIMTRLILDYYSPISFYFVRSLGILLISFAIFRPHFSKLESKIRWRILLIGSLWVGFRVLIYYGYLILGVIFTTLMIMLGPVFVFIFAKVFLKEKIGWKNIVASLVIVVSVLYVILV